MNLVGDERYEVRFLEDWGSEDHDPGPSQAGGFLWWRQRRRSTLKYDCYVVLVPIAVLRPVHPDLAVVEFRFPNLVKAETLQLASALV